MNYLSLFKMPTAMKIKGRASSITNVFVSSITPAVCPTENEVKKALSILKLGIPPEKFECCYCGDKVTEWDHLRPLVVNKEPTGRISEIRNLVPSCGKCNQSKGNRNWQEWINSDAPLSPKSRKIVDLKKRIVLLNNYEEWKEPGKELIKIDFALIVGKKDWEAYMDSCAKIIKLMQEAEKASEKIKKLVVTGV